MSSSYININRKSINSLDKSQYATDVVTLANFVKGNNTLEPMYNSTANYWTKITTVEGSNVEDKCTGITSKNGETILFMSNNFSVPDNYLKIYIKNNNTYILSTIINIEDYFLSSLRDIATDYYGNIIALCYIDYVEFYIKNEIGVFIKSTNNLSNTFDGKEFFRIIFNGENEIVIANKNNYLNSLNEYTNDFYIERHRYNYNFDTNTIILEEKINLFVLQDISLIFNIYSNIDYSKILVHYDKKIIDEDSTVKYINYINIYTKEPTNSNYISFFERENGQEYNAISANNDVSIFTITQILNSNKHLEIYKFNTNTSEYELIQTIIKNNTVTPSFNSDGNLLCIGILNKNEIYKFNNSTELWEIDTTITENFTSLPFNNIYPYINDDGTIIMHSYLNENNIEFDGSGQVIPRDYSFGYASLYEKISNDFNEALYFELVYNFKSDLYFGVNNDFTELSNVQLPIRNIHGTLSLEIQGATFSDGNQTNIITNPSIINEFPTISINIDSNNINKIVKLKFTNINLNNYFTSISNYKGNIGLPFYETKKTNTSSYLTNVNNFNSISNYITSLNGAFCYTKKFNQNISDWDVSNVIDMSGMFLYASAFNQDISNWDVSNVTFFSNMFNNSNNFNNNNIDFTGGKFASSLGEGSDDKKISMANMFSGATIFNQNISDWDVSKVFSTAYMFFNATHYNNGGVSFNGSRFASSLGEGPNDKQVYIAGMFFKATNFNQDISDWNMSYVLDMFQMFEDAINYNNGGISFSNSIFSSTLGYGTNMNITMTSMFKGATTFNQDISSWNMSAVEFISNMFENATNYNNGNGNEITSNLNLIYVNGNNNEGYTKFYNTFNISNFKRFNFSNMSNMLTGTNYTDEAKNTIIQELTNKP